MKWCCDAFRRATERAAQRGRAIIVTQYPESDDLLFTFQYRAVGLGLQIEGSDEVPVTIVHETCIRFCPWCGCLLERKYRKFNDELIEKLSHYAIPRP